MRPTWVVQTNLGNASDLARLGSTCRRQGLTCLEVEAVPFSDALPEVPNDVPTVFYGATQFANTVHRSRRWWPGAFFDEEAFRFGEMLRRYGSRMLNADAELTTLAELGARKLPAETLFFLRPDRDLKEFAGEVVEFGALAEWVQRISAGGFTLDPTCPVVVAEPVGIAEEWRLFVVGGQVCAASRYRVKQRLSVEPGAPDEVIRFAESCAATWSPSPVFVLDVARSGNGVYVVEVNCFNSAGFYACDLDAIVAAVSEWVDRANSVREAE